MTIEPGRGMFRSKTVIVIGAGASNEINLPVGAELKTIILGKLGFDFDEFNYLKSGDSEIHRAIVAHCHTTGTNGKRYLEACRALCRALPLGPSIDVILHSREHDENFAAFALCAKLAIAQSILEGERRSMLGPRLNLDDSLRISEAAKTWYGTFGSFLAENVGKSELHRLFEDVSFVIFNYDRCVEEYLYRHLQLYYGITAEAAAQLLDAACFYHP